ncbi:MAG: iron-sulfur cluster assembly protein, partial [Actinomycetota bacterium]
MSGPTRDEVIAALDQVLDPELHRSIVALGMVGSVDVDGARVAITIKLTVA